MSFTTIEQATPRLHRSELAVPGSMTALFEKAAASAADVVFLDLEDAVAPDDKDQARRNVIAAARYTRILWTSTPPDGASILTLAQAIDGDHSLSFDLEVA